MFWLRNLYTAARWKVLNDSYCRSHVIHNISLQRTLKLNMLMMNCGKFAFTGLHDPPSAHIKSLDILYVNLLKATLWSTCRRSPVLWMLNMLILSCDKLACWGLYRPHQSTGHAQCQPLKGHFEGRVPLLRDIGTVYQVTPSIWHQHNEPLASFAWWPIA